MCGEMGVPQSVYERYYKLKFGFKVDAPEEADLETNGPSGEDDVTRALELMDNPLYKPVVRSTGGQDGRRYYFCEKCDLAIDRNKGMHHCYDCQVCVEGYDHHCMFYSKCIAGGNVI
jgi:hypothetical protein